jgi:hypothetical protein
LTEDEVEEDLEEEEDCEKDEEVKTVGVEAEDFGTVVFTKEDEKEEKEEEEELIPE